MWVPGFGGMTVGTHPNTMTLRVWECPVAKGTMGTAGTIGSLEGT